MQNVVRYGMVAGLIWLIPFALSIPFFGADRQLLVNFWLFKGIMAVVLSTTSFVLLGWLYRKWQLQQRHWEGYAALGLGIMLINIILDVLTIVQFGRMSSVEYLSQIAVVYFLIVAISVIQGTRVQGGGKLYEVRP
jgi:hypothetical protein